MKENWLILKRNGNKIKFNAYVHILYKINISLEVALCKMNKYITILKKSKRMVEEVSEFNKNPLFKYVL